MTEITARPIGTVRSELRDLAAAPCQADEGAPAARLELDPALEPALDGLAAGQRIVVITWLHAADRSVLAAHPRGDPARRRAGVFATRSPHRPNPIGLHHTTITGISASSVYVDSLEAVDGTPILDIKPVLGAHDER